MATKNMIGAPTNSASRTPRRGTSQKVRMIPRINPAANTTAQYNAPILSLAFALVTAVQPNVWLCGPRDADNGMIFRRIRPRLSYAEFDYIIVPNNSLLTTRGYSPLCSSNDFAFGRSALSG